MGWNISDMVDKADLPAKSRGFSLPISTVRHHHVRDTQRVYRGGRKYRRRAGRPPQLWTAQKQITVRASGPPLHDHRRPEFSSAARYARTDFHPRFTKMRRGPPRQEVVAFRFDWPVGKRGCSSVACKKQNYATVGQGFPPLPVPTVWSGQTSVTQSLERQIRGKARLVFGGAYYVMVITVSR